MYMQYFHWFHKSKRKVDVVPDYGLSPATVFIDVAEKLFGNCWNGNSLLSTKFLRVTGFAFSGPRLECCWLNQYFGVWKEDQAYPTFRAGGMYTPGQVLKTKTVQLRAQGIRLGKISVLRDKCDLSVDYLPCADGTTSHCSHI